MPKRSPLITSSLALRGFATAVTLLSASSMTAFAATHVQNTAAPLQPTAPTTVAAAATPAPTATAARRTRVSTGVTTTTGTAVTTTHRS